MNLPIIQSEFISYDQNDTAEYATQGSDTPTMAMAATSSGLSAAGRRQSARIRVCRIRCVCGGGLCVCSVTCSPVIVINCW